MDVRCRMEWRLVLGCDLRAELKEEGVSRDYRHERVGGARPPSVGKSRLRGLGA